MASATRAHISGFDGLRAVAIVSVLAWHVRTFLGFPPEAIGPFAPFVSFGWAGVDLFFGLSAFLITTLLLREEERARASTGLPTFRLGRFYARRALRIVPALYFVLALDLLVFPRFDWCFVVASARHLGSIPVVPLVSMFGFFSNYVAFPPHGAEAFLVLWSLSVEEHFYLAWPIAIRLIGTRSMRTVVAALVCAVVLWARIRAVDVGTNPIILHQFSHFRFDALMWGALAALHFDLLATRTVLRRTILLCSWALVLFLVQRRELSISPPPGALGSTFGLSALAIACAALCVEIASAPRSAVVRALEFGPLRGIGRVSYGMYLLHPFAISAVVRARVFWVPGRPTLSYGLLVLATIGLSYALARAMWALIEAPALRLKDRRFSG